MAGGTPARASCRSNPFVPRSAAPPLGSRMMHRHHPFPHQLSAPTSPLPSPLKRCVATTPSLPHGTLLPHPTLSLCTSPLPIIAVHLRPPPFARTITLKTTTRGKEPVGHDLKWTARTALTKCIRQPTNTKHNSGQKRSDAARQNGRLHHTQRVGGTRPVETR